MTTREKTLKVIRRELEGYIPFQFDLCPSLVDELQKRTGTTDYRSYFKMPYHTVEAPYIGKKTDFTKYFGKIKPDTYFNEWGVGFEPSDTAHFTQMINPMKNFEELIEFENYPYPNPKTDYDWDILTKNVQTIKDQDKVTVGWLAITIFEIAWYLRGMEEFMMDMYFESENCLYHLDRITTIRCEQARLYASSGIDVLHLGDDIATQIDMMISPEMWRKHFKPRLKMVIDAAKSINPDILIDYHSDGNVTKVVPELIEIGIDILNPVQPECMDVIQLKKDFGNILSFRGTLGTQSVLPFGTPKDVEKSCREMIEIVGKGGGLILAPSHVLEPEVPWENLEAMIKTINDYNNEG
jgi:uroporphyrinogen decarboxylase